MNFITTELARASAATGVAVDRIESELREILGDITILPPIQSYYD